MTQPTEDKAPRLAPEWKEQPLVDRLTVCRQMLYLHGVLPAGENEKMKLRIRKLESKEGV
jgi:hypothetical protein